MTHPSSYIHGTDPEEQRRLALLNGLLNASSLDAMRLEPGDRVLDVGSGLGQLTRAIAREVGEEGRVLGIERDEEQLASARREAEAHGEADRVELRLGSAEEPPLEPEERGSFDLVHARFVLEHLVHPERAVAAMVEAVRPGGRIVLEDDDHDLLRLWPPAPEVDALWRAYADSYRHLGNDPYVGRRLVALLRGAGAEPRRTDMHFFGACAGSAVFEAMIDNFLGVLVGARRAIVEAGALDRRGVEEGLAAFDRWRNHPDASLWYATCWASAVRPGPGSEARARERASGEARRRRRPADTLDFLVDSARDLGSTLRLDEVLRRIARRVQSLAEAHLFCVLLWNEESQLLEHTFSLKFGEHIPQEGGFPLGYGLSGAAAESLRPIRVPDVRREPRYVRFRHAEVEIRSELVVPLVVDGRLVGVLDLESTELDAFGREHERVLSALASHMAAALENARLYEEVRSGHRRLEEELETARRVQRGLLPAVVPTIRGLDVGVARSAAEHLSGDFFDLLPTPTGGLAFALGDVAGHGTAAALLAALAVGALRGELVGGGRQPHEILARLNHQLYELNLEHRFVALLLGRWEAPGTLVLASAGIPAAIRLRDGAEVSHPLPGVPLGALPGQSYRPLQLEGRPGDRYLFFTDGVEEAGAQAAEQAGWGAEGLAHAAVEAATDTAQELADRLLAEAVERGRADPRPDDRTLLVLSLGASS